MKSFPNTFASLLKSVGSSMLLLMFLSTIFTSCFTAKKLDKKVAKQYGEITPPKKKQPNPNIFISSALVTADNKISKSVSKTSNVIPLIIYNQWNYKSTCTLNPQIPINNFIATVQKTANKSLKERIVDHTLEINVEKIPNIFSIDDQVHFIFFGYGFGWENIYIYSDKVDMVVSYKLLKDGLETKTGTINIPYIYDVQKLGLFKSWKKATTEFLDQYDLNITEMSKSFVQQLLLEI